MMPANTVYLLGGCPDLKASAAELWPCGACAAPHGFGRDDEWLPFAHTRDKMRPSATGVFSYHAAGCSDLELHMGGTLLARNRVHLAMRMTQLLGPLGPLDEAWPLERRRLYPGGEPLFEQPLTGLSDRDAIGHVARWVAWHDPGWTRPDKARFFNGLRNASLGFLLAEAARGIFAAPPPGKSALAPAAPCVGQQFDERGGLRACLCDGARATWRRRTQALTSLSGDPVLDKYNVALIEIAAEREAARHGFGAPEDGASVPPQCSLLDAEEGLGRRGGRRGSAPAPACPRLLPIDRVQMYEQPQGSSSFRWAREIWDLRTILLPARRALAAAGANETGAVAGEGARGQPRGASPARAAHQTDEVLLERLRRGHVRLRGADAVASCEEGPASRCLVCNGSRLEALLSPRQMVDCNAPSSRMNLLSG